MSKLKKKLEEAATGGELKMIPKSKRKWALTRTKEMKSFITDMEAAIKEGYAGDSWHYLKNVEMWMEDLRNMMARYI